MSSYRAVLYNNVGTVFLPVMIASLKHCLAYFLGSDNRRELGDLRREFSHDGGKTAYESSIGASVMIPYVRSYTTTHFFLPVLSRMHVISLYSHL